MVLYQLSVFVHIVSAMVWVGGMLFLALVIVPSTRSLPAKERGALLSVVGRRFRAVGWSAIGLLLLTGVANAAFRGVTWGSLVSGQFFESTFGLVLMAKLGLVVAMLALSLVHDVVLGPAATRALQQPDGRTIREVAKLRRQASWVARVETILGLLVVMLAIALVRGWPW